MFEPEGGGKQTNNVPTGKERERDEKRRRSEGAKERERENGLFSRGAGGKEGDFCKDALVVVQLLKLSQRGQSRPTRHDGRRELCLAKQGVGDRQVTTEQGLAVLAVVLLAEYIQVERRARPGRG